MLNEISKPDSRFMGPTPISVQVPRNRLLPVICALGGTLTLLSAPAGFGKTTVMAQALEQFERSGVKTAWLNANATDNDLSRFLGCLDKVVIHLGIFRPGQDAITALAASKEPFALFIDDLENIQERSVLALLQEIAQNLPHRAHLIVGTRGTPALGLAPLRMIGRLTEIDAAQLRFDISETKELLGSQLLTGNLTMPEVKLLQDKTEGWAAALWLACMALKRSNSDVGFVAQFSGATSTVAEYLTEVVLADLPLVVRRVLLRLSVLRQFNVSICAALNPDINAGEMIEYLLMQGLVIPHEKRKASWRFHGLFAEYLRNQLNRESPAEWPVLHLAASGWYEANSQHVLAIDHALKCKAYDHAILLLEKHAESLLEQGRMRLLSRWFALLPPTLIEAHPALHIISIWAVALTEGAHQALEKLELINWRVSQDARVRNHGAALYPTLLGMQDKCEDALSVGMRALENMDAGHNFASATLLNAIAHQILIIGHARDAQRMIDAARRLHGGESIFNRMYSETTEGLIDLLHGRLRHATARFRLAVDATHANDNRHSHGNAWAGVLYTATMYESNDLAQVSHLINVYLPLAREVGIPDHLILIYLLKCRLAFIESDIDTALQAVTELEYIGHRRVLPRVVAAAQLERAKILLMQSNALASQDELLRADDPDLWARECRQRLHAHDIHYLRLARLRWEIHFGDPVAALKQLDVDLNEARKAGRRHRALVLQLLRAVALHRCDNALASHQELEDALEFASREGYIRTVLDEGPALGCLILEFKHAYESHGVRDPLLMDYLRGILLAFGPLSPPCNTIASTAARLAEPLTRKEIEVMKFLSEGCSNVDLAERLHVSNSTVRTHLRNINAKLCSHSRTQALATARKLGLLS
jgi:LuxR family maltose regulon positive regulatory protein